MSSLASGILRGPHVLQRRAARSRRCRLPRFPRRYDVDVLRRERLVRCYVVFELHTDEV